MDLRRQLEALSELHGWDALREALAAATAAERTVSLSSLEDGPTGGQGTRVRYEDRGLLGLGANGEVRRVWDRELDRVVARKTLRADRLVDGRAVERFLHEARIAAALQHPGIPPVYEVGQHDDGRPWFTMMEVRGTSLHELSRAVYAGGVAGWTQARSVEVFARVCDAVAYAHAHGVTHGDLKPGNVVVGNHGETLVVDWGSARRAVGGPRGVEGTAAYLAPEVAALLRTEPDPRSDVYALGATLYHLLAGRSPFEGDAPPEVLRRVLEGPPAPLAEVAPWAAPELVSLVERCMEREPDRRPPTAEPVAEEVRAFLDGVRRREQALASVEEAAELGVRAREASARAAELDQQAVEAGAGVRTWEPEERKWPRWELQDAASALRARAALLELQRSTALQAALVHEPLLPEAHAVLALEAVERHAAAEERRDEARVGEAAWIAGRHAAALPSEHPARLRVLRHLRGMGELTVWTDPPGALVELHRYVTVRRRRVAVPDRVVGPTPIDGLPLPVGSWLCVLRVPGRPPVRYPVRIERDRAWDGVPPGATSPLPVVLPEPGEVPEDAVYVPAGWFTSGGDPEVGSPPPRRRWCDGLVVRRFPVTVAEYLRFLDGLVAEGREEEALARSPRGVGAEGSGSQAPWERAPDGTFRLSPSSSWRPDWPVVLVSHPDARAFLAREAAPAGSPWRLPGEHEWEKAARGVDGRWFPWGDAFDFAWCCLGDSHPDVRQPAPVESFPVDESVYGVRGMAGNVQEWCADRLHRPDEGEIVPEPDPDDDDGAVIRMVRGGAWALDPRYARCAARPRLEAMVRVTTVGFRGVRRLRRPVPYST